LVPLKIDAFNFLGSALRNGDLDDVILLLQIFALVDVNFVTARLICNLPPQVFDGILQLKFLLDVLQFFNLTQFS